MKSRRTILALSASSLLPLTGCAGTLTETSTPTPTQTEKPDQDYDGVSDGEDDYPDNGVAAKRIINLSETVTLPPTEIETYPINAERDGLIKYDMIAQGGPIDLLFLDRENYDKWQKGDDDAEYRVVLSAINKASASTEQMLSAGNYVIVLDHSKAMTTPNAEEVTVDFSLEVGIEGE